MGRPISKKVTSFSLTKTFTYYIPEPTQRKSGYREREFDKIMQGILTSGFEIISFHAAPVSNGVFLVALIKARTQKIFNTDLNLDLQEKFQLSQTHSSPDITLDMDDE